MIITLSEHNIAHHKWTSMRKIVKLKVLERRKSVIASIHLSLKSEQHLGIPLDPVPW